MAGKLKLTNDKSQFTAQPLPDTEEFERRAGRVFSEAEQRKKLCFEVANKFVAIVNDKTLAANRGPIAKALEDDVRAKLVALGVELNTDINEQDGMGSMGLITLLLRTTLIQRDRINELEYKLHKIEEKLNDKK